MCFLGNVLLNMGQGSVEAIEGLLAFRGELDRDLELFALDGVVLAVGTILKIIVDSVTVILSTRNSETDLVTP